MAEQQPIEGFNWDELDSLEESITGDDMLVWEQDYLQHLAGLETKEEIDRECRFWMLWKRMGNVFQSAAIDRRVEMTRAETQSIVQEGEQMFRPDVRLRMAQERRKFWQRNR